MIFKEISEEELADILPFLEEVSVGTDELIFKKGELGHSMYIIVDGLVRVHDGGCTLNYLGKGDVYAREQRMKQQVAELRIEIEQRKQDQRVAEITETGYFRHLVEKVVFLKV